MTTSDRHPARTHWFFIVAAFVVAGNIFVALSSRGAIDRIVEAGLIFDLAFLLPCLYWLCYRASGKKAAIRAVGLCCLGIWGALKLVPEAEQDLLAYVAPARYVGIAALICLEVAVLVAVYRTMFKGGSDQEVTARIQAQTDLPPWVARLLALEARFWRKVWQVVKKVIGRD